MSEELRDRIKSVIDNEPVTLFMKGTPTFVMCGNSERALQALRNAGAPVTTVDILPDPEIRQELSALSGWPTIPQVFIKGELVGGADIVQELAETGELERKLADALGDDYRDAAEERVVSVLVPCVARLFTAAGTALARAPGGVAALYALLLALVGVHEHRCSCSTEPSSCSSASLLLPGSRRVREHTWPRWARIWPGGWGVLVRGLVTDCARRHSK